ncbi:MAG: carboxymuconolactone decarboxylase family protein [Coprobacillus cateniformis]|uniref:carboxymuconolactone decarboxylase family protein n=1 Tax=Longibaculum muris TaxID=1796628 RepID=UPI003AB39EEA|nr:carboxymuconolactone decarboxylase family protein [Coprobacillus cateniformis]
MRDLNKANELFEQLHDKDILKDDLELQAIMKNYIYGDVYQHGTLDIKLRELILIVVNTTNHTLSALKEHIIAAIKVGVSPIEVKEVIYQCTPYIGLGKVQEALDVVNPVFKKYNISTKPQSTVCEETRFEKGFEVQSSAFGKDHIQAGHDQAPQELKHIQNYLSEYCFGDFYTREGLDLKTRELMTMVMLATLGGCENQLRGHVGANITVGNSRELLIETITQCQPYIGFPRTLNAIAIINEVTK